MVSKVWDSFFLKFMKATTFSFRKQLLMEDFIAGRLSSSFAWQRGFPEGYKAKTESQSQSHT